MNRFVAMIGGLLYAQSVLGVITIPPGGQATLQAGPDMSYTVQGGGKRH